MQRERGRRGEAEHTAGRTTGEHVRVEEQSTRRATEHRHDVEQRESRVAGCGFEEDTDLVEDEHVERDVKEPVVHDRVRDEPVVLPVVHARAEHRQVERCGAATVEAAVAQRDHDVRNDRAGDDRLGDPRRPGSGAQLASHPFGTWRRGRVHALEAVRPDTRLDEALGARRTPAARAPAPGLATRVVETGRRRRTLAAGWVPCARAFRMAHASTSVLGTRRSVRSPTSSSPSPIVTPRAWRPYRSRRLRFTG